MWWIVLAVSIIVGFACWVALSKKWLTATDNNSFFNLKLIEMLLVFHPILPGAHPGFMDLKWTIVRHGFVASASAVLIWFVDIGFLEILVVSLNLLYAIMAANRYRNRKEEFATIWYEESRNNQTDHANGRIARPLAEASKIPAVYSFIVYAALQLMLIYKWFSI
jgi:hypothetical protein